MKSILTAIAVILALPALAQAHCVSSTEQASCEKGVEVYRGNPLPMPAIHPVTAAKLETQEKILAARQAAAAEKTALERERLAIEAQRVSNETYLYRAANSPLRERRRDYRYYNGGFVTPFGIGQTSRRGIVIVPGR